MQMCQGKVGCYAGDYKWSVYWHQCKFCSDYYLLTTVCVKRFNQGQDTRLVPLFGEAAYVLWLTWLFQVWLVRSRLLGKGKQQSKRLSGPHGPRGISGHTNLASQDLQGEAKLLLSQEKSLLGRKQLLIFLWPCFEPWSDTPMQSKLSTYQLPSWKARPTLPLLCCSRDQLKQGPTKPTITAVWTSSKKKEWRILSGLQQDVLLLVPAPVIPGQMISGIMTTSSSAEILLTAYCQGTIFSIFFH